MNSSLKWGRCGTCGIRLASRLDRGAELWEPASSTGFVFVDRLLAMLVNLRPGTTHDVPACRFGVDRSTTTRAMGGVRPLLVQRGCTIAPSIPLRSLADVIEPRSFTPEAAMSCQAA
ncbi:hypothetical protein BIV25_01055 [Streptomyces sp. MUSC 14]|uniref:helix-turn-helix domain-containing protein n=1 Tax=Streptomyces sp. MUSC 14 TaxID=1354889 RepID=UPI0008F58246|nr:transposase family protein [Streptomyces sp. MUSC 14]OIK02826.1 hypothetical protein BIV25_01055 [Streptomyces sp. MUSC 14]